MKKVEIQDLAQWMSLAIQKAHKLYYKQSQYEIRPRPTKMLNEGDCLTGCNTMSP